MKYERIARRGAAGVDQERQIRGEDVKNIYLVLLGRQPEMALDPEAVWPETAISFGIKVVQSGEFRGLTNRYLEGNKLPHTSLSAGLFEEAKSWMTGSGLVDEDATSLTWIHLLHSFLQALLRQIDAPSSELQKFAKRLQRLTAATHTQVEQRATPQPVLQSGREPTSRQKVVLVEAPAEPAHSFVGKIEHIDEGSIKGWLYLEDPGAVPYLTVGGRVATPVRTDVPRKDVSDALGIPGDHGFEFYIGATEVGEEVVLYALSSTGLWELTRQTCTSHFTESRFLNQIAKAAQISRQPDALAVVCWDGAHNPVGRAKVLADVASVSRPTVLVTYLFDEFGGALWAPLRSADLCLVTIPWKKRDLYHCALQAAGVQFDKIWICKSRLPSFLLAKHLSTPDARLVLDYDDNEEHFSKGKNSVDKPYGLPTINLSARLSSNIPARTAASITLSEEFNAQIVRHARVPAAPSADRKSGPVKIAFIGTVRAHKGILEAARAIQLLRYTSQLDVEFHVYGDVQPERLVDELADAGVVVLQNVPMAELASHLQQMDIILSGFPVVGDEEITRYQISSKIGDGLSVGKPVLVPLSPSTADLQDVPGVILFDRRTFGQAVMKAARYDDTISLPFEFTLEGAHQSFEAVLEKAADAPRSGEALAVLPNLPVVAGDAAPALLLIWKQHDAGLYGRRIDQVARAYKQAFPGHRVIILELVHPTTKKAYHSRQGSYTSEHSKILAMAPIKEERGLADDGTVVRQLRFPSASALGGELENFLISNGLLPTNTVVVLFPIIQLLENALSTLSPYRKVVDVVDNQFSWGRQEQISSKRFQYASLFQEADLILFNSVANLEFFQESNLIPALAQTDIVKNWYAVPNDAEAEDRVNLGSTNVIYSGNMNDRIDWLLLQLVVQSRPDVTFHLVGTSNMERPEAIALAGMPNVLFHGPLQERETLRLLRAMDLAIMPHTVDQVSMFMNPLKVQMYRAVGIRVLSTKVPGLDPHPLLTLAEDSVEFLKALNVLLSEKAELSPDLELRSDAEKYIAHLQALHPAMEHGTSHAAPTIETIEPIASGPASPPEQIETGLHATAS
jgi:glycosyltransferase involved in cell wall biosynthesis